MKIGVISDTHDRLESLEKILEIVKKRKVELIIHCGDWVSPFTIDYWDNISKDFRIPIKSIFGNNEGDKPRFIIRNNKLTNPIEFHDGKLLELEFDNHKIAILHGDDKAKLQELIDSQRYDCVFTGHTHKARNEIIGRTLVLNPGSTSFVQDSRVVNKASIAIYDSVSNRAEIVEWEKTC
jgi:uncharacterized protein